MLLQKISGNSPLFLKIKNKLMWSSIFRSVIQTYLPTCLMIFTLVKVSIENKSFNLVDSFSSVLKLGLLIFVPISSVTFLRTNLKSLGED
jgi:hypothetical protein